MSGAMAGVTFEPAAHSTAFGDPRPGASKFGGNASFKVPSLWSVRPAFGVRGEAPLLASTLSFVFATERNCFRSFFLSWFSSFLDWFDLFDSLVRVRIAGDRLENKLPRYQHL